MNRAQGMGMLLWGLLLSGCDENNPCYKLHPTAECTRLDLSGLGQDLSVPDLKEPPSDLAPTCKKVADTANTGEVLVPCGWYLQGSVPGDKNDPLQTDDGNAEYPATMEFVQAFYMDQTEVTTSAYQACVTGGGCIAAETGSPCNYGDTTKAQHPINCVTWDQAWAYCKWRKARLPTETEWEYAARGPAHSAYPWGNTPPIPPGSDQGLSQACWDNANGSSTCPVGGPAGAYPSTLLGQVSTIQANGIYDLAGNVWEWTDTQYGSYPPNTSLNNNDGGENTERVLRGGSWGVNDPSLLRAANRNDGDAGVTRVLLGFRCARTPLYQGE